MSGVVNNRLELSEGRKPVFLVMAALVALLLMVACPSTALYPLPITLVDADLMPGVDSQPAVGWATVDTAEKTGGTRWMTWVFRVRLRNDGELPLRNVETRLEASDAIKSFYNGTDPFATEAGKRTNYGKLALALEPGDELEIKRSIFVFPLLSDSDGNDETPSSDGFTRFRAVRAAADQAVFWITFEGGGQRFDLSGLSEHKDWPPFTMVYELADGQSVMVGDRRVDSRQLRRFEYHSETDWVDTVLESADIETRVGTFNAAGSYRRLDGRRMIEYDSVTKSTREDAVDEGSRHIARSFFLPYRNREFEELSGITPVKVKTSALVCFRDECEDNAAGLLYLRENGQENVFADDSRGFPLRIGTLFVVKELRVDDEQK